VSHHTPEAFPLSILHHLRSVTGAAAGVAAESWRLFALGILHGTLAIASAVSR
jgi:hypothetical protein